MQVNFDNLVNMTNEEMERIVGEMGSDDVLLHINQLRSRTMHKGPEQIHEKEVRFSIMLVRKLRSMRESKNAAAKKAAPKADLDSLFSSL